MSLSAPRLLFGVHSVTPYSRSTGEFYGTAKVLGEASIAMSGEIVSLYGGSSRHAWANEDGAIKTDISLKLKQYEDFLFQLFLGKAPTAYTADTAGTVSTLTNVYGTSAKHATTGIASVSVKSSAKADLKFTKYIVKVVTSTTVDVYAASDADFARGTDIAFVNDLLKVTATPLTITAATGTDVPSVGLTLTGGSGTIGMTVGDTASFDVKPVSTKSIEATVGAAADTYPEFGLIIMAQQNGSQEMFEIDIFKAKGIGMPIAFAEKKFSEPEIKVMAAYDSVKDGVFKLRHITPA